MTAQHSLVSVTVLGAVFLACAQFGQGGSARAAAAPRAAYDFEDGEQGFAAVGIREGQVGPDADSRLEVAREKDLVRAGTGSLHYTYMVEPKVIRALSAETRLPADARSVRLWVRSSTQTTLVFSATEQDGARYELAFHVPAFEWTEVAANLDEFLPAGEGQGQKGPLKAERVVALGVLDLANALVNTPGDLAKALPNLRGQRQLWLDDLRFSPTSVAQASGALKTNAGEAYVVDSFDAGLVRWAPVRVVVANDAPFFEIFPANTSLKVLAEAAAPGAARTPVDPGGKGLRFTYRRAPQEIFGLLCSLERSDLSRAERLRLSLNVSQKSVLFVQLKEKDESEYQHVIEPDNSVGWHDLDLPLTGLTLGQNSKDENAKLDPDQLKEIAVIDGSGFLGAALGQGETTLELDAVSFKLK